MQYKIQPGDPHQNKGGAGAGPEQWIQWLYHNLALKQQMVLLSTGITFWRLNWSARLQEILRDRDGTIFQDIAYMLNHQHLYCAVSPAKRGKVVVTPWRQEEWMCVELRWSMGMPYYNWKWKSAATLIWKGYDYQGLSLFRNESWNYTTKPSIPPELTW